MSFAVHRQLNDIGHDYGAYRLRKRTTYRDGLNKGTSNASVDAPADHYASWSLQRVHDKKDSPAYALGRIEAFARHRAPRDRAVFDGILQKLRGMRFRNSRT